MKRVALFALPIVGMLAVVGLGLFFLTRSQAIRIGPRMAAARGAIADAIDSVAEEIEEALE